MEDSQVSRTALINAYVRGYHAEHDNPKIFNDFLAFRLLTEMERESIEQMFLAHAPSQLFPDKASALAWLMQIMAGNPICLSRARFTEDSLEDAVKKGVKQYVILGAGLDTFALRHLDLLDQLQVFEVDHPATQAFKRQRINESGLKQPSNLEFIPIDFTKDNLLKELKSSSFNPQIPTFYSWLGVTYYLPNNVVFDTLRLIADFSSKGTIIVFDYLDTEAFIPEKAAPRVQILLRSVKQQGETMKAGFEPLTLSSDLSELGLHLHEDLSPWDIQLRYFMGRTDNYHATEHTHMAYTVVK